MLSLVCSVILKRDIFTHNYNVLQVYKKLHGQKDLLGNSYNFSYTMNSDGCQASDSSSVSIWPIYIMLHELPDKLRKKFMILAGLWVAKSEPNMNTFLQPFVDQANRLASVGFKWVYNGCTIKSRLFCLG